MRERVNDAGGDPPTLDVVVPVHNGEAVLASSVSLLHRYLSVSFPYSWRVTIVDSASTDGTPELAAHLASSLPGVRVVRLAHPGRGLAVRTAWSHSEAAVVAYVDADLPAGLDALLPLVAPLITGHSDVAIGSRLAPGANVARGARGEVVSRLHNLLLQGVFANRFRDARCGFKAMRTDVAHRLLPHVGDDGWFFDTELLLLADRNGLRIHEVPVDWVDDPDGRVAAGPTPVDELKGSARVGWRLATGRGAIDLGPDARWPFPEARGRRAVTCAVVGTASALVGAGLFLALRSPAGPAVAVVLAMLASTTAGSWAHRRRSFGRRGRAGPPRQVAASVALTAGGVVLALAAVAAVGRAGGGVAAELGGLLATWGLVAAGRFRLLAPAGRVSRSPRTAPPRSERPELLEPAA